MINDNLNQHEEQAMDALLSELYAQADPPDLTQQIMSRLDSQPHPSVVVQDSPLATRRKSSGKPLVTILSVVGALAASWLLFVLMRGDVNDPAPGETAIADSQGESGTAAVEAIASADNAQPKAPALKPAGTPKRLQKAVPLVAADGNDADDSSLDRVATIVAPETTSDPESILLVSKRVDADLLQYWQAVGVHPTEDASATDLADRLIAQWGVQIDPQTLDDPQSLHQQLTTDSAAKRLARHWLVQVTGGGLSRLDQQAKGRLVSAVTEAFQGKRRLDTMLARWFAGQDPETSDWYAAMAAAGRDTMVHRMASLSMNVDVRCIQCHDSKIEGSGRQEDYWTFASLVRQGVRRDRDGNWSVADKHASQQPTFYELPDGRQKMVQPAVPSHWLTGADGSIENLQNWSQQIVASKPLASGIVNSLWAMVHDRPLQGNAVDTISAPQHESLQQFQDHLVSDLLNSNFDVSRTLSLMIHSPASRRSVPTALQAGNTLLASDVELRHAHDIVGAFAGTLPVRSKPGIGKRVDLAMRSAGGVASIREGDTINAQADGSAGGSTGGSSKQPRMVDDTSGGFPIAAKQPPVQWLGSIKGFDQQVQHLGYLAGLNEVPEQVRQVAGAMKKSDQISDELALHRVWWLLSP